MHTANSNWQTYLKLSDDGDPLSGDHEEVHAYMALKARARVNDMNACTCTHSNLQLLSVHGSPADALYLAYFPNLIIAMVNDAL